MSIFTHDIRYGLRMFARSRSFTAISILTIALGIGANTAIFSVVNAVLLRPLPYLDPARLVVVWSTAESQGVPISGSSAPDFREWRSQNSAFADLAAYTFANLNLVSGSGFPERVTAARVTPNMFSVLGLRLGDGRDFNAGEDAWGAHRVAILSHTLWTTRFGGQPDVLGQQVRLSGEDYTIIGITAEGMPFLDNVPSVDLYIPLAFAPDDPFNTRNNQFLPVIGRLHPGASIEAAQSDLAVITARLEQQYPENKGHGVKVTSLTEEMVGEFRTPLYVLLGVVFFVLMVGCANVASLLMARAASREREFAIRAALGARRFRIIRQLLVESLLLGLIGGGAGLLLAIWSLDILESFIPRDLPRFNPLRVDPSVLGFTLIASILTAIIFGLAPAFHAAGADINQTLKESGRGSTQGRSQRRWRAALVVVELAMACVLMVGAGLMARSFFALHRVDTGFDPRNVVTMQIALPESKYPVPTSGRYPRQSVEFFDALLARVRDLPGVTSAGVTTILPLNYGVGWGKNITVEGLPTAMSLDQVPSVRFQLGSPNYLQAVGARLIEGRLFSEQDNESSAPVAIVNETTARRFFPNESPVGHVISMTPPANLLPPAPPGSPVTPRRTIVGVIADIKDNRVNRPAFAEVYAPYRQCVGEGWNNTLRLAVRTNAEPFSVAAQIREQVTALDPEQPVADIATLDGLIGRSLSAQRFNSVLMAIFAGLALVLAMFGIYGVMSYGVEQRTHEIGLRMALGARSSDVIRLIVGQGAILALCGVAIGIAGSLALTRLLSALLFEVSPTDLGTFFGSAVLLGAVALAASYWPARRAARVDPMTAMRYE